LLTQIEQNRLLLGMLERERERSRSRSVTSRHDEPGARVRRDSREGRGGREGRSQSRVRQPSRERGTPRERRPSATAGAASGSTGPGWRPSWHGAPPSATAGAASGSTGFGWRPGWHGAPRVQHVYQAQRRRYSKPPVGYFSGGSKGQVEASASARADTDCPWVSDDEDDVPGLRPTSPIPWEEDSRAARAFREVSELVMQGDWKEAALRLLDWPQLRRLRIPDGEGPGAGYGLLHTLLTKRAPDWLTEWVLHRTPMDVLGFGCNEKL